MSQQILNRPLLITEDKPSAKTSAISWQAYIPVVMAIGGALAMLLTRINVGNERFISDEALMMLALASYLIAAVFYLTNLYAPFRFAENATNSADKTLLGIATINGEKEVTP